MNRSLDELIDAVLDRMIGAEGQVHSVYQRDKVRSRVEPLLASMAARNIIFIPFTDEYSLEYFSELVDVLVANCAEDFGFPARDQDAAERKLYKIARVSTGVYRPLRVDAALTTISQRRPF